MSQWCKFENLLWVNQKHRKDFLSHFNQFIAFLESQTGGGDLLCALQAQSGHNLKMEPKWSGERKNSNLIVRVQQLVFSAVLLAQSKPASYPYESVKMF